MSTLLRRGVSTIASMLISTAVFATPITVEFAGTWLGQMKGGISEPVTSTPSNFTASFTFNPSRFDDLKDPYLYGYNSAVAFEEASASYSVDQFVSNPFGTDTYATSAWYGRAYFSSYGYGGPPTYKEGFRFTDSASSTSGTSYWGNSIVLSYYLPVATGGPLIYIEQDYVDMLYSALLSGTSFNANYDNRIQTTYPSGYMDLYAAGYMVYGTAKIISISQVPEPQTIFLFGVGLVIAALTRKQRRAA